MYHVQITKNAHAGNIPESAWKTDTRHRKFSRALQSWQRNHNRARGEGGLCSWYFNVRIMKEVDGELVELSDSERDEFYECIYGIRDD